MPLPDENFAETMPIPSLVKFAEIKESYVIHQSFYSKDFKN
jgi:hypothetical protein